MIIMTYPSVSMIYCSELGKGATSEAGNSYAYSCLIINSTKFTIIFSH